MAIYIYQQKKGPNFHWDRERIASRLVEVRYHQGRLLGKMESLSPDLRTEANLYVLTQNILSSSEIDGAFLDPARVRSSIALRLGMNVSEPIPPAPPIEGIAEMMLNATQCFSAPLTNERLFGWHAALFSKRHSTQVVSGSTGKEKIHIQAPHSSALAMELRRFLDWFNAENGLDPVIKAAIAHLWFVTLHLFTEGNGRIASALTDMQLSKADGNAQRFYSLSAQISSERQEYYGILEKTQKENLNITSWLNWFLDRLDRAILNTDETLAGVRRKAGFWEKYPAASFNGRQRMMLDKLLDGFTGKLTSSQWATLAKTSQDSAGRDITDLVQRGILVKQPGGGRSTSYQLAPL